MNDATATKRQNKVDIEDAERFLAALDPGEDFFCFQTFDDYPDRELKDKKLAEHRSGSLADFEDWLIRAPHIISETSQGHYHVFWRVADLPLDRWEDVQRGLAKRFDGDPAVATLERCTRLPGFFNCKDADNPFRVRIVEINKRSPYSADNILKEFPPEKKAHKAERSGKQIILPAGAPLTAAEAFVNHRYSLGEIPLLWSYRGAFYRWTGTHYCEYEDEALERDLYKFLDTVLVVGKNGTPGPYNPTKNKVPEVVHALRRGCLIPREWDTPCWLGHKGNYKPATDLGACRNGVLHLVTRGLQPHDPLFFTTNCLPLDYEATAPKPKRWLQFLADVWRQTRRAISTKKLKTPCRKSSVIS
jgi:RepB DNA-primase N-terminal domain/D5 N terminal like